MAFDNREISWYNGRKFGTPKNGVQFSLKGEPDEFLVSWPGNDFKLQNFIERHVPLNDEIKLDNNELRYEGKAITKLSRKGINNLSRQRSFRISNIMRYSCGEYYQNRNPQYYQDLCRQVKERGWFYLPLVEQI